MACGDEGQQPSTIFLSSGLELDHLAIDSMHAADLGCFQDALGSLFWLEIYNKQWYPNRFAGIAALNRDLEAFYYVNRDRGLSKATPLTLSQIIGAKPGYPYLKCKAAQTRHMVEFGWV